MGELIAWLAAFIALIATVVSIGRRSRGRRGPGATGAIYDMLNEDKRKAIEIIVEERAEARDPEDADGNLPDLEEPGR
jgi:hypothetical protein